MSFKAFTSIYSIPIAIRHFAILNRTFDIQSTNRSRIHDFPISKRRKQTASARAIRLYDFCLLRNDVFRSGFLNASEHLLAIITGVYRRAAATPVYSA